MVVTYLEVPGIALQILGTLTRTGAERSETAGRCLRLRIIKRLGSLAWKMAEGQWNGTMASAGWQALLQLAEAEDFVWTGDLIEADIAIQEAGREIVELRVY